MKEVVNNYFAKYNSRATNQNIKRLAETQKKKMFKKFGRDKHSSEFTLNIKDAELLEQFKGFCFKYLRTRGTNQV